MCVYGDTYERNCSNLFQKALRALFSRDIPEKKTGSVAKDKMHGTSRGSIADSN